MVTARPKPSPQLQRWLLQANSLTRCLRSLHGTSFRVELLDLSWRTASGEEARVLGLPRRERLLVREVLLLGAGQPLVFARSLLPVRTLRGRHQQLARLGSRPLGELLFTDKRICRGNRETAQLIPTTELYRQAAASAILGELPLWARRTPFHLDSGPIVVIECFLPAITTQSPPREQ